MAAIALTESSLADLKRAVRNALPEVGSSHLSEALACALRRRTHASLRADLISHRDDPPIELLDDERFHARLRELGNARARAFSFDGLRDAGLLATVDERGLSIRYDSLRRCAWRNLMVCAVNAALERKLISLRPGDNRWPNAERGGCLFDFTLPDGFPARGSLHDVGWAEVEVQAAVNPKRDWVPGAEPSFWYGDAFASAWLERERGLWLQSSATLFKCRAGLLLALAAIAVEPAGYGDRGRVIV